MRYCVYVTSTKISNIRYVGHTHLKKIDRGYIGCGINSQSRAERRAKSRNGFAKYVAFYGYESFQCTPIAFFENKNDAIDFEKSIVTKEFVKLNSNYNIVPAYGSEKQVNHLGRKVYQYSVGGDFIKEFRSQAEASREVGVNTPISFACNGQKKTLGGYRWSFSKLDRLPEIKIKRTAGGHAVFQYDLQGKLVKEWGSVSEITSKTDYKRSSISNVLNGHKKTSGGFVWSYNKTQ